MPAGRVRTSWPRGAEDSGYDRHDAYRDEIPDVERVRHPTVDDLGNGDIMTMALPPSFAGYDPTDDIYDDDPALAEGHFHAAFGGDVRDERFRPTIAYNSGTLTHRTVAQKLAGRLPVGILGGLPDDPDPDPVAVLPLHRLSPL